MSVMDVLIDTNDLSWHVSLIVASRQHLNPIIAVDKPFEVIVSDLNKLNGTFGYFNWKMDEITNAISLKLISIWVVRYDFS